MQQTLVIPGEHMPFNLVIYFSGRR